MKKLLVLLLSLLMVCSMAVTASADILWEPFNDSFYDHKSCATVAATYFVPENSTVTLYKSPKDSTVLAVCEAGTRIYVGFKQTVNGEEWGVGYAYGDYETEGWFRLGRLQKEYNHQDFIIDFGIECTQDDSVIITKDDVEGDIPTWTYPGSGVQDGMIPYDALGGDYNDGVVSFQKLYTAPDGSRWGYVGYYMGRCGWVWLDDPDNAETPLLVQTPEITVTDKSPTEQAPTGKILPVQVSAFNGDVYLVVGLVAAIVVVTAVLIVSTKRK